MNKGILVKTYYKYERDEDFNFENDFKKSLLYNNDYFYIYTEDEDFIRIFKLNNE